MAKRNSGKRLKGKPVILDKLDAELGGKLVEAVMDDMQRAADERSGDRSEASRTRPERSRVGTKKRR